MALARPLTILCALVVVAGTLSGVRAMSPTTRPLPPDFNSVCATCTYADFNPVALTHELETRLKESVYFVTNNPVAGGTNTFCVNGTNAAEVITGFLELPVAVLDSVYNATNCARSATEMPTRMTTQSPNPTTTTGGNFTTPAPPPTTTATSGSTTAPVTTPAPPVTPAPQPLEFTVTFLNETAARAFVTKLAEAYGISVNDIRVVSVDNTTVVFRFVGSDAGALSARFNGTPLGDLRREFGVDTMESHPAPADSGPDDDDGTLRLILFIVVPIAGVLLIVAIVVIIRMRLRKPDSERVPFNRYIEMSEQPGQTPRAGGYQQVAQTPHSHGGVRPRDDLAL